MDDLKALVGEHATIEEYATREEWLQARLTGIGASDLPIILGMSRYMSPVELWAQKTGKAGDNAEVSEAAEFGIALEPIVKRKYVERTGRALLGLAPFTIVRSVHFPWMVASLDDVVLPGEGKGPGAMEAKTTSAFRREDWLDEPPLPHQVQTQWQMGVVGWAWASIGVVIGGQVFKYADVDRSDNFIGIAMAEAEAFWKLVKDGKQPAVDGSESTTRALALLYPRPEPGVVITLPDEAIAVDIELRRLQDEAKASEERVAELRNKLKGWIGEAEAGEVPKLGALWNWKTKSRKEHMVAAASWRELRRSALKNGV
jgi:putative phage-type endonuclease